MKGASHIEADFYIMLKTELQNLIKGKVYRSGMRPMNAKSEDAVITYKSGFSGQFQVGEVMVNIYTPNIKYNGEFTKDSARCREIENAMCELTNTLTTGEYLIQLINIPNTVEEEVINQHYVNTRLKFKRRNYARS